MSTHLLLADLQKAFLQVALRDTDRDAFHFLFDINGVEKHLRVTRVPFGVEASPFMLGATLPHHFSQKSERFASTVESLKDNTYVDNLMKSAQDVSELEDFKQQSKMILEDAKFLVHKWESNVDKLDEEPNPSKTLGYKWDKREDTLKFSAQRINDEMPVTKRHILRELNSIYDPLGIISPTTVEGKRIYREACEENIEVSAVVSKDWKRWGQ